MASVSPASCRKLHLIPPWDSQEQLEAGIFPDNVCGPSWTTSICLQSPASLLLGYILCMFWLCGTRRERSYTSLCFSTCWRIAYARHSSSVYDTSGGVFKLSHFCAVGHVRRVFHELEEICRVRDYSILHLLKVGSILILDFPGRAAKSEITSPGRRWMKCWRCLVLPSIFNNLCNTLACRCDTSESLRMQNSFAQRAQGKGNLSQKTGLKNEQILHTSDSTQCFFKTKSASKTGNFLNFRQLF